MRALSGTTHTHNPRLPFKMRLSINIYFVVHVNKMSCEWGGLIRARVKSYLMHVVKLFTVYWAPHVKCIVVGGNRSRRATLRCDVGWIYFTGGNWASREYFTRASRKNILIFGGYRKPRHKLPDAHARARLNHPRPKQPHLPLLNLNLPEIRLSNYYYYYTQFYHASKINYFLRRGF